MPIRLHEPRARGSILALILLILLLLGITVGALQHLTNETRRQARLLFVSDSGLYRAEAIINLLVSRWKKDIVYQNYCPLRLAASGTESGVWDSLPYVLGWQREKLESFRPTRHVAVWIRPTNERPVRTFRFDLRIRTPTTLSPRVVEITGLSLDSIDPVSETERRKAFERIEAVEVPSPRQEAAVEVLTSRVEKLAEVGATPRQIEAAIQPSLLESAIVAVQSFLLDRAEFQAAEDSAARVTGAQKALATARALPERERKDWTDLALFQLANELVNDANDRPLAKRIELLTQAVTLLERILGSDSACCGAPRVAWMLAQLIMKLRPDWIDPAVLARARSSAVAILRTMADRSPKDPIHPRTDITREELPGFLSDLWRARVAVSIQVSNRQYLLASMLQDGSSQISHLEATVPIQPLAWHSDGSEIYAICGSLGGQSSWRMSLDGLTVTPVFNKAIAVSELRPGLHQQEGWHRLLAVEEIRGGGSRVVSGRYYSDKSDSPDVDRFSAWGKDRYWKEIELSLPTKVLTPIVSAPTGERFAQLKAASTSQGLEIQVETVTGFDTETRQRLGTVTVPGARAVKGLSWQTYPGAQWLAFAVITDTERQVHFVRPDVAGSPIVTRKIASSEGSTSVLAEGRVGQIGTLVAYPPGYLLAGSDRMHFLPLPGSRSVPAEWPVNMRGSLSNIDYLQSPPWGRCVFFQEGADESKTRLLSLDLTTGEALVIAGPGGVFPYCSRAFGPSLSPIPEVAGP